MPAPSCEASASGQRGAVPAARSRRFVDGFVMVGGMLHGAMCGEMHAEHEARNVIAHVPSFWHREPLQGFLLMTLQSHGRAGRHRTRCLVAQLDHIRTMGFNTRDRTSTVPGCKGRGQRALHALLEPKAVRPTRSSRTQGSYKTP